MNKFRSIYDSGFCKLTIDSDELKTSFILCRGNSTCYAMISLYGSQLDPE